MNRTNLKLLISTHREIPQEQNMIEVSALVKNSLQAINVLCTVGILSLLIFYFCIYKMCPLHYPIKLHLSLDILFIFDQPASSLQDSK